MKLPPGVRTPFEVYVNGVRQELGVDYQDHGAASCVFERELVRQKLGLRAWLLGFWGIGTYKRNDEIDIRYEVDGRPMVAHGLEIIPPEPDHLAPHPGAQQLQRREDRPGGRRAVERVEVDAGRSARQQLGALQRGVGDPELGDRLGIGGPLLELLEQRLGDRRRRTCR